jgi:hypothetical protein
VEILSNAPDEFLDTPTLKPKPLAVSRPEGECNVCVQLATQDKNMFYLVSAFSALCAPKQSITRTHCIALLVLLPDRDTPMRIGYCTELSANSIILRLCLNAGAECTVIRDYDLNTQKVLTEDDLGKRPFKF